MTYKKIINSGLYAGSKAALEAISESMRLELKPFGVRVVTVITGATQTNTFVNAPPPLPEGSLYSKAEKEIGDRQNGRHAEGRLGTPEELARSLAGMYWEEPQGECSGGNMLRLQRWFRHIYRSLFRYLSPPNFKIYRRLNPRIQD